MCLRPDMIIEHFSLQKTDTDFCCSLETHFKYSILTTCKVVFGKVLVRLVRYGKSYRFFLPKCRVRVWKSYRTYQSVGYRYGCCTELTKVSGTGMDTCTRIRTPPVVFQQGRTRYQGILPRYESAGYGYGYGSDVVPSLPKGRVWVWMLYQAHQRKGRIRV